MNTLRISKWFIIFVFFFSVFLIFDYCVTTSLQHHFLPGQSTAFLNGIFSINLVYNRGAAFGMLQGMNNFLIGVGILFFVFLWFLILQDNRKTSYKAFYYALICSGALGNLIERILYGYVIDYFDFHFWPVFNVSDSYITVGGMLLFWDILVRKEQIFRKACQK